MLQGLNYFSGPLLDTSVHVSLAAGNPALDAALQICLTSTEQGKDHDPHPVGNAFLFLQVTTAVITVSPTASM